jgi:transcriptional regulator with XRE-family HTH domain
VILKLMPRKNKPEVRGQLPPRCAAVKRLREAYGDTLERFSQRIGISMTSASRFELGKATPKDPAVLTKLYHAALEQGLKPEILVFREGIRLKGDPAQAIYSFSKGEPTLKQWRVMAAARILNACYPERMPALMEVLRPALDLVDTVIREIQDPGQIDYQAIDRRLTRLADRQAVLELQQELQQRKKDK